MPLRTSTKRIDCWDDLQDLEGLVCDKRSHKRAGAAKRRRRNRRYENRILNSCNLDD